MCQGFLGRFQKLEAGIRRSEKRRGEWEKGSGQDKIESSEKSKIQGLYQSLINDFRGVFNLFQCAVFKGIRGDYGPEWLPPLFKTLLKLTKQCFRFGGTLIEKNRAKPPHLLENVPDCDVTS
ncbi:hypothetical protein IAD21_01618 [Abditibacteriota bacterium]|nr:hypothetical protein IAD21_01618 [Abditibacteriota bacterium]